MSSDHRAAEAVAARPARWVGQPVRRREDPRFLRGQARFVDDISLPGMLHLAVVRSAVAHALLRNLSVDAARSAPGVVEVVTAADLTGRARPLPVRSIEGATVAPASHPLLAEERVRYVGEPVAAMLADSPTRAREAAGLVDIDYDPLPALVHPADALRGETLLHPALGDNVLIRWARAGGDPTGAFAAAARVVKGQFHIPRLIAAPMEPRGAVAMYDGGVDLLTVWCSAQDPHRPLAQLSYILNRPEDRIRVVVPDVGGAFGIKGALPPEAAVAALLAIQVGRPVKWIEDRRENLLASYMGRGLDAEVEMAVDGNGRITGIRAKLVADLGAYLYPATPTVPVTTGMLLTGAYAVPHAQVELVGVATNKVPTGPYRGAGRPEAAYIVERMLDLVAAETTLDPIELRLRNFIPPEAFPYATPLGFVYDSGNYARALERCRTLVEYDRWREEQRRARASGRLVGIGVALYVERAGSQLWESAAVSVGPVGRVIVRTGSNSHGQGHETTFAQIAADALGVDLDAVVIEHGDSAVVPRGVGTFASRSTAIGGSALLVALDKIKAKAAVIAAQLLEAAPADIEWTDGRLRVRGSPQRALVFSEVAAAAYRPGRLPPHIEMGLDASGYFSLTGPVFPFGAYAAVVEIHRETGEVEILRLVAVDDAGRIVNPLLAEGQVLGAIAQGLGQVFVEEAVYDRDGQPLTATFADYALLRAGDVPAVVTELLETPSPLNPLGAKGIGEAGAIGAPAAVANAVMDALSPLGVRHVDMPFTPAKLWEIISAGGD
ncbi:MAG: xanthine dehydrogenase family protein molybdopterin-binding subunit [Armatimonadota bacterium]